MIKKNDISEFFNQEAEASKNSWEALMALPVKERVRKRKAIESVFLDREYRVITDNGYIQLKLSVGLNLSDFKEGECVLLHKDDSLIGIKCTISSFEDDDTIIIEVYPPNLPSNLPYYFDIPLLLDKDLVDLRENVFYKFLAELPVENDYWNKSIINTQSTPLFDNIQKYEDELDDTCVNFKLKLLPKQREAIVKSMAAKDYYLIQGPPGTGKSFVLGVIIAEELAYFDHKVVIIGPNHMAINNALGQALKVYPTYSAAMLKVGQNYNAPMHVVTYENEEYKIANIQILNTDAANSSEHSWLIGLTPHGLYTSRADSLKCDTLIIDEAGQMTIPLALMGMIRAKKVIIAGDHKQLPPIVSSEDMSEEMKKSVFQTLITEENCTMLDTSFRMCEPICDFVSDLFYEGKVKPMNKGCGDKIVCQDSLYSFTNPVVIHHVDDNGEQTSDKEAAFISDTISKYLELGLPARDIAVLTPFRAQAANVRRHIRKHSGISEEDRQQIASDTIDKMQGQEREVILFSLVAGNLDYMTEMADFLYNPNKLNVAFSRAKSKLIIVGNIKQLRNISPVDYPHISKMLDSDYVTLV